MSGKRTVLNSRIANGVMALALAVLFCGCAKIQTYMDKLPDTPTTNQTGAVVIHPDTQGTKEGTLWPAHVAPRFMAHGIDGENEYRQAALTAAQSSAVDCIRCDFNFGASDELLIHLTCLEHPDRAGYFNERDNWFFIAEKYGVRKFAYNVGALDAAKVARLLYVFRHPIARGRVQIVCASGADAELVEKLRCGNCEVVVE